MKKAHNNKKNENKQHTENFDVLEAEETVVDDILDDGNEEETTLKEWDIADDDEIHEFLTRDLDVVNRTRQRLREKQEAKEQAELEKKSRKSAKPKKEKKEKKPKKVEEASSEVGNEGEKETKPQKSGKSDKNPLETVVVFIKKLWTSWLDIYHKHTMQILYGALGALALILLIAIFATNVSDKKPVKEPEEETSSSEEVESSTDEEPTTEDAKVPVAEAEDSDIHKIVASYYDALYVKATIEEVSKYVDNVTNFNESRLKTYDKYYESVSDIKCYKYETTRVENSYVVFVTYDIKMYNIETAVPSGEALVVKQGTDGKYLIHNLTDQEILDLKISNEDYVEYISQLEKQVLADFNAALAADAELKEVYDMMQGLANKATEQSSTQGNSGNEAGAETTTADQ